MRKSILASLLVGSAFLSPGALAGETGIAGYSDTRIKTYLFDPTQVYRITAHFGFVTTIQFAKGEKVDSVQLGDHVSWQVDRLRQRWSGWLSSSCGQDWDCYEPRSSIRRDGVINP